MLCVCRFSLFVAMCRDRSLTRVWGWPGLDKMAWKYPFEECELDVKRRSADSDEAMMDKIPDSILILLATIGVPLSKVVLASAAKDVAFHLNRVTRESKVKAPADWRTQVDNKANEKQNELERRNGGDPMVYNTAAVRQDLGVEALPTTAQARSILLSREKEMRKIYSSDGPNAKTFDKWVEACFLFSFVCLWMTFPDPPLVCV